MDLTEEQMKFIGFFGIFKESFKTIRSWKKIFAQITFTLILPLAIIFLAQTAISHHVFSEIENTGSDRRRTTATDWVYYWLFKLAYFTFFTVFSLLSTAAVVYTIACVYTGRSIVYRSVMKVVPKVWKRLFVTFVCIFFALFVYNAVAGIVLFLSAAILGFSIFGIILFFILLLIYVFGFLYLSAVWQLAGVVSVLENIYGLKAMTKGKDLVKGKTGVAIGVSFVLYGLLVGIVILYEVFVEYGGDIFHIGIGWRVVIGIVCVFLLMGLFLLFIVSQTVVYLVCKSHHREAIDKVSLATYLGSYLDDGLRTPAGADEIQLGRPQPQRPSEV